MPVDVLDIAHTGKSVRDLSRSLDSICMLRVTPHGDAAAIKKDWPSLMVSIRRMLVPRAGHRGCGIAMSSFLTGRAIRSGAGRGDGASHRRALSGVAGGACCG